ncbi:MAG: hypothetical protein M0R02_02530 [Bacteroidales bacterium]|nr:hypothetical protein [Bacteroidales bacterium]
MKHILFFIISMLATASLYAQPTSVKRVEYSMKNDISVLSYVPFGQEGYIQRSIDKEINKKNKKVNTITYTKFNTDLEPVFETNIAIPIKNYATFIDTSTHFMYELSYSNKRNYIIHKIDVATMNVTQLSGAFQKKMYVQNVVAINECLYILGAIKKNPFLLIKNTAHNTETIAKIIPSSIRDFSIISMHKDSKSPEMFLFARDKIAGELVVKMYVFENGTKKTEIIIPQQQNDVYVTNFSASKIADNSYILTGTYKPSKKHLVSNGIFIMKIENKQIVFTKFYNYLDIQNFTSYLSQRQQDKIERKKTRKRAKGKDLAYNYFIASHPIHYYNGTYTLVGEAYYPTYRTECYPTVTSTGTRTTCTQVFDGYEYTHYFLMSFNEQGEILWSNSKAFALTYKPMNIMRFLKVQHTEQTTNVVYTTSNKFYYAIFKDGNETTSQEYALVETLDENDDVRVSSARTYYWYDDFYITHGYQKIKNKEEGEKRKVYYLNKIQLLTE